MSRQALALDALLAEINAYAPHRSKASDGGLGDPAHAARASDHNPNAAGVWRARDFTNDPPGGLDCDALAAWLEDAIRKGEHPALGSGAYIIWDRRIFSRNRQDEGWRPYSGPNPHNKHLHLSVATAASGYDSTLPWGVFNEEDDMANSDEILAELKALSKKVDDLTAVEAKRYKNLNGKINEIVSKVRELFTKASA